LEEEAGNLENGGNGKLEDHRLAVAASENIRRRSTESRLLRGTKRGGITKMKKFHPAATPNDSSTNLPAKRMNGDVIGK
jgi:hypothetical protein